MIGHMEAICVLEAVTVCCGQRPQQFKNPRNLKMVTVSNPHKLFERRTDSKMLVLNVYVIRLMADALINTRDTYLTGIFSPKMFMHK